MRAAVRNLILFSGSGAPVTYDSFVNGLSPILWLRLRETSGTTPVNSGSAGAALDGVYTPGTGAVGQTGLLGANEAYSFDGADSKIVVTSTAAHNALPAFTRIFLIKPTNSGEGGSGSFFFWDTSTGEGCLFFNGALTSIQGIVKSTGNATSTTTTGLSAGVYAALFMTYDHAGDKKVHLYKYAAGGSLTEFGYSAQTAATGSLGTPAGDYNIGNRQTNNTTFNGVMDEVLTIGSVLSNAQMTQYAQLAGL